MKNGNKNKNPVMKYIKFTYISISFFEFQYVFVLDLIVYFEVNVNKSLI